MRHIVLTIFYLALWTGGVFSQVAVIANKSVPVDEIEKSDLLDCYTGDKSFWSDGKRVTIFDLKEKGNVRDSFYKFLGISSTRIKSIWMKRMLSGDADPPEFLESEDKMVQKVSSTKGAIGFVNKAKANDEVKIILLLPTERN
jgi:ABC-type phosphate transport system substrate-binding protein